MQLERDPLDAVLGGEPRQLLPEGDRLGPLALEEGERVVRPRVPDPVHGGRAGPVAGRAGHRDDLVDAEQAGEPDRPLDARALLVADHRVEREARAVEGRDAQSAIREGPGEGGALPGVRQQLHRVRVGLVRGPADGDLDRGRADVRREVEGGLERQARHRVGEEAEVHPVRLLMGRRRGRDQPTPKIRLRAIAPLGSRSSSARPATPRS